MEFNQTSLWTMMVSTSEIHREKKHQLTQKMALFFKRIQIAVDPAISSFRFSSKTSN